MYLVLEPLTVVLRTDTVELGTPAVEMDGLDDGQTRFLKILLDLYDPFVRGKHFENLLGVKTKKTKSIACCICLLWTITRSITRKITTE